MELNEQPAEHSKCTATFFSHLEHTVTVVDLAALGCRLTVKLSEKVEGDDSVEIDHHDHKEGGHDQLSTVVDHGAQDCPKTLEVDDQVKKMDGEVEDAQLKSNEAEDAVDHVVQDHLWVRGQSLKFKTHVHRSKYNGWFMQANTRTMSLRVTPSDHRR